MMFGFGGADVLIIGLFYAGIGLPLGVPPAEQDPLMLRVAPEKCLYYTTWAGMAKPHADSGNETEALLAEPQVQRFIQQIDKAISEALKRAAAEERNPEAALLAEMAPIWGKTLLTSPTAIYVSDLKLQPNGPPQIQAAAIVNTGDQTIVIRDSLVKLQARHLGEAVKEIDIGGVTFYQFRLADDAPLVTWGVRGKYILMGVGDDAVQSLLANARTGPPAWLTDLQKQLPVERTSTITYADLGGLIARSFEGLEGNDVVQARKLVDALGLTNVTSYAAVSGLEKEGFITRTTIGIEGESRGIFALTDAKPLTAADFAPIPRDATAAFVLRLDGRKVLDTVQSVARDADPQTADQIDAGLDALAKWLGMDLREEILAGLGDTWCIYNSQNEGGLLFTGLTATVDVRDKAKVDKAYKRLMALAAASLRGPDVAGEAPDRRFGRLQPKLKTIEFQGRTIYYLTGLGGDFPFAPAWCLTDTHLVASLFPQNIEAMLARDDAFQSLASAPEIAESLPSETGPLSITYFDTQALFEVLYPMAKMAATAAFNELAQRQGVDIDVTILPQAQSISRHLRPSVTAVARTDRGLEFTSRQSLPGSSAGATTPVAVALLLPAIQAAREAAQRAQSMNNLKQIALAMHNHDATFGAFPSASMKTKDGKPGLSWRVKILPYIEQGALYDQFRHDQPWDSEHNQKLLAQMPSIYRSPKSAAPAGYTNYLGAKGEDGFFKNDDKGTRAAEVRDGFSNTIMVVEVNDKAAVPWTKPDDFDPADGMKPTTNLGGLWSTGIFLTAFADGSVRVISSNVDAASLKAMFTKSGGEVVGPDALDGARRGAPRRDFDAVEEAVEEFAEPAELVP